MQHREEFINEMKDILLQEKVRLEQELSRFAKTAEEVGNYEAQFNDIGREPEDNAHEVEVYESDLALEKTLEGRLKDIREALERIDNGSYGVSEKSGELIEEDRLRALPEAKTNIGE